MFTRVPSDRLPQRRRPLTLVLVVVGVVYLALAALSNLWTDFLWFGSIGFDDIWQKKWGTTVLLGAGGVAITFALLWLTQYLVSRLSPHWAAFDLTEEEEILERFREWVEPRMGRTRLAVSAVLALVFGLTPAFWTDNVFLFLNGLSFGKGDPIFDRDVGFYVFDLPFWNLLVDWGFSLLIVTTLVAALLHFLNGGIRVRGRRVTVSKPAKLHLSVMFALIALMRAAAYRLDMFDLLLSDRASSTFFGPGFADVEARLPALRLLMIVALVVAVLFIVNYFRRGWLLTGVAVGSWLLVSIAAAVIYPWAIQRLQVTPRELVRETPYIEHNLDFTRTAWGLDQVRVSQFAASSNLDAAGIDANRLTIDNLRIWDPSVLPRTYQSFQELRPYYGLARVDTDRYLTGGEPNQVMLAVRELDEVQVPEDWQNQTLFYTHGFGAVVNQATVVEEDGQPQFLLEDVPPRATEAVLELTEPRVYFGESYEPDKPVIVKTGDSPQEVDFPLSDSGTASNQYAGDAGVDLNGIWRRIAFALRYQDLNLLISGEIRNESRVIVERNVREVVEAVAPFLTADTDPYPVILNGRILWVLDLYTSTTHYPYSQPMTESARGRLAQSTRLGRGVNYMRNSVKAVIDAYNGDVTYYLFDESDPIAATWNKVYPDLMTPRSEMPAGLIDHLRYPQDLFRVQSELYLEYHVTDPVEKFTRNDAWDLPVDPATINRGQEGSGAEYLRGDITAAGIDYREEILPYYLLTRLPGEDDLSYLLLQPFTPREKKNMSGFLVADSTPGRYGRLIDFRMPQGKLVDGTEQVGQRIEQDAEIAEQFTFWRGQGSKVVKGDLLVVPVEDSIIYVQPVYLEADEGGFPEFRRVVVVFGDRVEWADTLDASLDLVFGAAESPDPGSPDPTPDGETVAALLAQADAAFSQADAALRRGDLASYQRLVDEARRLIGEAQALLEGSVETLRSIYTG